MKVGYPVDDDDKGMPCLIDVGGAYALLSDAHLAGGSGGLQYTEGATDPSITGNALMWEDAADTLVVASAAKPLPVEVVAGAAAGTEYTEAEAAPAAAAGGTVLAVREDNLAGLPVGTDEGDWVPLRVDANGALHIAVGALPEVVIDDAVPPHVEVDARPAIDNTTDAITTVPHSGVINVGLDEKTVEKVNVVTSTDGSLVAAQGAGNKIRVVAIYAYPTGGANTFEIEDGAGGTVLFGPHPLAADQPLRLKDEHGLFDDTTANTALHLDITNATNILFLISYIVVT